MSTLIVDDLELTDEVDLQGWYRTSSLTDGLPIVVPTVDRVERFIEASRFDRARRVGVLEPGLGVATVENVAVNAVMAGCPPQALGVVLAALESMTKPPYNLRGVQTTTNPVAPLTIVNGPARGELGIASGGHALGGGPYSNGVIGRAIRLALRNIGGQGVEESQATLADVARYTFCLAEDEEASPWEPLHVFLGYDADQSVVTTLGVECKLNLIALSDNPETLLAQFAHTMRFAGSNTVTGQGTLLWVLNPSHARYLAQAGHTRRSLQERLFEDSLVDPDDWPFPVPPGVPRESDHESAHGWWPERGKVRVTESPSDIQIVVAGRDHPIQAAYMPPMGFSNMTSATVWKPDR